MAKEIGIRDCPTPQSDSGVKRRGLLRLGTLMTALTGASAVSAMGAEGAQAAPGDKNSNTYIPTAEKAKPSGVATLDENSKVPPAQLPDLSETIATQVAPKLDADDAAATYATLLGVAADLDAEQVRADTEYRKKDSTMYIPYDHSWWAALDTQSEGFGPDSSGNPRRIWGLLMSGATPTSSLNNPGAHTKFRVPAGWNTVSVKILYTATTTAGGNAAWNGGLYNATDGNSYNAGSGIASGATSVGTVAWVQKSHQATTVLAVDPTKTQILHIYRNALSATDTYNDSVMFLGVEISWVS